jgi:hypothetical protein
MQKDILYLLQNLPSNANGQPSRVVPVDMKQMQKRFLDGSNSMEQNRPMLPIRQMASGAIYIYL